jgi:queuine/archaeosine tRNA-ribosyltransferase
VFKHRLSPEKLRDVIAAFDEGIVADVGEDITSPVEAGLVATLPALREPVAATLCTVHNLTWMLTFVGRIRDAIGSGTLSVLRAETAEVWSGSGPGLNP